MASRIMTAGIVLLFCSSRIWADDPDVLSIGFVESLLRESPPGQSKLFGNEFRKMVLDFTGLKSVTLLGLSPTSAAQQLNNGKWHLGVFHGVEFAWIQAKHPKLLPLMIAAVDHSPVRAVLVVKKDSILGNVADLKGKDIRILTRLHCKLFADKTTGKASDYFGKMLQTHSVEEALDEVLRDHVQGAMVDTLALSIYKDLQPGRFKHLKVVAESEPFPPAVIVHRQGCLSDAMLNLLKERMLKVNQSEKGRESLSSFHITGFQLVPADYQKTLTNIVRAHPAPE